MSYQVLARKYRPQNFAQVAGQQHILNSLIHALDQKRLHHAYLFTGTRGVGKTSLARLLAKSLNCLKGISSKPCQKCPNCLAILQGNFVDLIEIDAASRTKVEDTREILDNIQYMPNRGRFKIYLIDEVHMLSGHSFNALLKTLEEPPEHVKFLLATTDPQKLPVTILSRCLQLNLKHLTSTQIAEQLQVILKKENIKFEKNALDLIAHAANGSMRDALSLTDQAISFTEASLNSANIKTMLGIVESEMIEVLIHSILAREVDHIIRYAHEILLSGKEPLRVLDALADTFYHASIFQFTQEHHGRLNCLPSTIQQLSEQRSADILQLYFQLIVKAKEDIPLAPTPECGLGMALLRLCAFDKVNPDNEKHKAGKTEQSFLINSRKESTLKNKPLIAKTPDLKPKALNNNDTTVTFKDSSNTLQDWFRLSQNLALKGTALQIVLNSKLTSCKGNTYHLAPAESVRPLITERSSKKIEQALTEKLKRQIKVVFLTSGHPEKTCEENKPVTDHLSPEIREATENRHHTSSVQAAATTPAEIHRRHNIEKKTAIIDQLNHHPAIENLKSFGFELDKDSVKLKS